MIQKERLVFMSLLCISYTGLLQFIHLSAVLIYSGHQCNEYSRVDASHVAGIKQTNKQINFLPTVSEMDKLHST